MGGTIVHVNGITAHVGLDSKVSDALHIVEDVNKDILSSCRVKGILERLLKPSRRCQKLFELKQAILEGTRMDLSPYRLIEYKEAMEVLEPHRDDPDVKRDYDISLIIYKILIGN